MRKFTVLIKPVSSLCNMDCLYCFYKDVAKKRILTNKKMNIETVTQLIEKSFSYCKEKTIIEFCFQGGEPLLAGIDFFRKFISIVESMNTNHYIKYSVQTNGILINEQWIQLFKQYHFLVGISLDGIKQTHDYSRKICERGSFKQVIDSIELLKINQIEYNILTVVSSFLSSYAKEIYEFYKEYDFKYVQFIPCLPSLDGVGGLKPNEYSSFFIELYKQWRHDRNIHISLFDQIENLIKGDKTCSCGMLGYCSIQIVVESDGSLYPCDFYALDEYCLGNINNVSFKNIVYSPKASMFLKEEKNFSNLCDMCNYYDICQGNCKRQNLCMFDDDYCGYKELLDYITKRI